MIAWELSSLSVRYPNGSEAVHSVNLSVGRGERVGLIGRSGCGKTTLARAGLGLIPSIGQISILGESTSRWGRADWLRARGRTQLLFQDSAAMLHPNMPIGVLLADSARVHRIGGRTEAIQALETVGLADRASAYPHQLSGGERRRAGLARVLMTKPSLLVADEPTAGVDAHGKGALLELMLDATPADCALVLISHDLHAVAWATDRVMVMSEGSLMDSFSPQGAYHPEERHPASNELWAPTGSH